MGVVALVLVLLAGTADAPKPPATLTDQELAAMWGDLARADDDGVRKAYQVIVRLVQTPTQAIPFLKARLRPAEAPDDKKVAGWIADLDSDDFAVRDKATTELEMLGALAMPAVKAKLTAQVPSLEARRRLERLVEKVEGNLMSGEELRALRAVEILENIDSPETRQLIAALAKGAPGARLTMDAQRAQARFAAHAAAATK